jgi:hypothetical protein
MEGVDMPEKTLQPTTPGHESGFTIKTARVSTGSIAALGQSEITVTWPTPFPSTSYTAAAFVEEGTATTDTLKVLKIASRAPDSCVVLVQNLDISARTGTLHVFAIPG